MRTSPRQCSLPMPLPYHVHIWCLPPRILAWWISSLSLICIAEMDIQDPFPYGNSLIVSKLYQWAELFCLQCFHLPFWCFNLKYFGSSTDFWVPLIHGLCALGHFWVFLQYNHCTSSITVSRAVAEMSARYPWSDLHLGSGGWVVHHKWLMLLCCLLVRSMLWAPCTRNWLLQGLWQLIKVLFYKEEVDEELGLETTC